MRTCPYFDFKKCAQAGSTACAAKIHLGKHDPALVSANDNFPDTNNVVVVPPARLLLTKQYVTRMAFALANMRIPRREVPNLMANALFLRDTEFRFCGGEKYEIGDEEIDSAFGADGSFKWIADFTNLRRYPLIQNPHHTNELRLRLMALWFLVDFPEIAKHFAV